MNRIIRWLRALRLQRRAERVELLGGYPGDGPYLEIRRFEPALEHGSRTERILLGVSRLGPESVDEATGHPLDNLVNAQGNEWQYKLRQQYFVYQAAASSSLRQAEALVEQYGQLHEADAARLHDTEVAVEAALLALSGHEPNPVVGSARGGRPMSASGPAGRERTDEPTSPDHPAKASPGTEPASPPEGPAAFAPPKVSRTELRRLLSPQDADRVPRWGEPGFRDAALLAGRPLSAYLYALTLILAAGADLGAFVQVVELVLPQQDWVIWLVVLGLTAVVLFIAHMTGVMLREAKAAHHGGGARSPGRLGGWLGRRVGAFVCIIVWLALGLMAFWVRLTVPLPGTAQFSLGGIGSGGGGSGGIGSGGIGGGGIGGGPATGTSTGQHTLQGAAIFLGLYLATGLAAAVGAYFTHNPYRGRYAAAIRAYRKASERAAASAYQLGQAWALYERQRAEIDAAERVLAEAANQDKAFTEQLKQSARIEIARGAGDPAVTDAIFQEDHQPYWS